MDLTTEFTGYVESHIPPGFFVRLAEEYEQDYASALDFCLRRFNREEAMDLLPYERRARNETSLLHVAMEFRHRGIAAASVPNITGSNFHVEVVVGPILLTSSFVQHSGGLVRMAEFRGTLAHDRQESFLTDERPAGDRFYALHLHGNKRIEKVRYHGVLGFFELAVPSNNCEQYLDTPMNLAARYRNEEVDPADVRAAAEAGFRVEGQRQPSALLADYRRLLGRNS
ncbi:MAG: hypothetical protein WB681_08380 [Candidatus Cybelea sp.]